MPNDSDANHDLEIGHVLFLDIVGYSKLLNEDQQERLRELTDIVLAAPQVAKSTDEQLVRLPTGDGMALVFRQSVEEPARCALEIAEALRKHPELPVRMGIHSGPVSEVTDVNGRTNIAGAGINMAQRVMDCGDAGHILLSQHVADDLEHLRQWAPRLRELGECEVKHGVRLRLVNLYAEPLGNPEPPAKFKQSTAAAPRAKPKRMLWPQIIAALLLIGAVVAGTFFYFKKGALRQPLPAAIPDKSVAVLPFENLSSDPNNAFFAEGVQDEILTDLAKIADLKVISRTSVMQYKTGAARNLPEIGQQLGVAHLLEGSVQRAADKVRVNAQLINARTDAHEWAENYDRPLDDVFAIQSEISKAIADQLRARIAPSQLEQMARKPTDNLAAYDAYLRGMGYLEGTNAFAPENTAEAIKYLEQATQLDSSFAKAWAALVKALMLQFFNDPQQPPATLQAAREAAQKAYALAPSSAESMLAQGYLAYYGEGNYEEARQWFEKARALAPGDANTAAALAGILRRVGKWQESAAHYRRAAELDPRNASVLETQLDLLMMMRDYRAAAITNDALLKIAPEDKGALASRIYLFQATGDLQAAAALLPPLPADPKSENGDLLLSRVTQLAYERRAPEAIAALRAVLPSVNHGLGPSASDFWLQTSYLWQALGFLYRDTGNLGQARITAEHITAEWEREVRQAKAGFVYPWFERRAIAYALGGQKEKAIAMAQQLETTNDTYFAVRSSYLKAVIGVLSADREMALKNLAVAAQKPGGDPSYGELKFFPLWDPLRGDPRFEQILASLARKQQ